MWNPGCELSPRGCEVGRPYPGARRVELGIRTWDEGCRRNYSRPARVSCAGSGSQQGPLVPENTSLKVPPDPLDTHTAAPKPSGRARSVFRAPWGPGEGNNTCSPRAPRPLSSRLLMDTHRTTRQTRGAEVPKIDLQFRAPLTNFRPGTCAPAHALRSSCTRPVQLRNRIHRSWRGPGQCSAVCGNAQHRTMPC